MADEGQACEALRADDSGAVSMFRKPSIPKTRYSENMLICLDTKVMVALYPYNTKLISPTARCSEIVSTAT